MRWIVLLLAVGCLGAAPQKTLRDEVEELKAEVRALREQVAELRKLLEVAAVQPRTQPVLNRDEAKIQQAKRERRPEVGMTLKEWEQVSERGVCSCWYDRSGTSDEGDTYLLTRSDVAGVAPGQTHWSVVVDGNNVVKKWRVWTPQRGR